MTFTIDELTVPTTLEGPGAADFIRAVEVGNEVEAIGYGTADIGYEPAEEIPLFHDPHKPERMLVARVDGEIVARGIYEATTGDDADTAWVVAEVLPDFRGRGIGTALMDELEQLARDNGKVKAIVYAPVLDVPGERLDSPTGVGSISADAAQVRFLQSRGYTFEQVERMSRLTLPVENIDELVAAAHERSGPDYVLHTWVGRTPERWLEDRATLATRMSTDAPTAGLEEPVDVWTVQRILDQENRDEKMNPRDRVVVAAEHVPSGHLVGYSVLSVPQQARRAVDQYATLVLKEHRGHALGMLLKVGNIAHLEEVRPGHPSILTFNAEENRHMLSVNEAVGFVGIANESAWRKDLS